MNNLEAMKRKLEARGFGCTILASAAEAAQEALRRIGTEETVGIGGSMTVQQLNLAERLRERGNTVHWHWEAAPGQADAVRTAACAAQVYLCSANAVTEDGRLVNIDGAGNRLAALCYGPGRVLVIVGRNKLCGDVNDALERIHSVACPQNARRLGLKTPCAATGRCMDCKSPDRMCNLTLVLERRPNSHPVDILLVDEDLGY